MQAFCSTSLRVITGPALTTIILAPASAQAHWGHLSEFAVHDHGHHHHPYPYADHPFGPESVSNRKLSGKSGG